MTKHIEKLASKVSAKNWPKLRFWFSSLIQVLDYDPLADTHHNAKNIEKEIIELKARIYELENNKLTA